MAAPAVRDTPSQILDASESASRAYIRAGLGKAAVATRLLEWAEHGKRE